MPARKQAAAPRGKSGLFAKVCQAIWGTAFVAPAAKCCGVDRKQVRRWLDDVAPVPGYAWKRLLETLIGHEQKLKGLCEQVVGHVPRELLEERA